MPSRWQTAKTNSVFMWTNQVFRYFQPTYRKASPLRVLAEPGLEKGKKDLLALASERRAELPKAIEKTL